MSENQDRTSEVSNEANTIEGAAAGARPRSARVIAPSNCSEAAISTCAPPPRPPVALLPFGSYIPPSELPSPRRRITSIPFGLSVSPLSISSLFQRHFTDPSTVFYADDLILPDGAPLQLSQLHHLLSDPARPPADSVSRPEDESSSAPQRRSGRGELQLRSQRRE